MARNKPIRIQTPPSLNQQPKVSLVKADFDAKIEQFGYVVTIEKAVKCPCATYSTGYSPLSDCQNCGGTGWIFANKTQTRAIVAAINATPGFKEWSHENIGTASITTRFVDKLSFMDRVTLLTGETEYSEYSTAVSTVDEQGTNLIVCLPFYPPMSVDVIFRFRGSSEKLEVLVPIEDYIISDNRIVFTANYIEKVGAQNILNQTFSLRYTHRPQFHVINLMRDIMTSPVVDKITKERREDTFPTYAMMRRAHLVFDRENYLGTRILLNDYDCNK